MKVQENITTLVNQFTDENGYDPRAGARKAFLDYCLDNGVKNPHRDLTDASNEVEAAFSIGSLVPGAKYDYPTPNGTRTAKVIDAKNGVKNSDTETFLVCFSGHMGAHIHTMETLRNTAKSYDYLPEILAIGKGGNKGLFENVFNCQDGIMVKAEYEAYYRAMEIVLPESFVRKNERTCMDMDTLGNFDELYKFAKAKGLKKVRFVLCTGNPFYEKRLLSEFMLWLRDNSFDVDMEIVISHTANNRLNVYDGKPSEIHFGYIAAAIGPLAKDTICFDGTTKSEHPERYLMDGVEDFDWSKVQNIITYFSNMGWPDYQKILYGTSQEEAVKNILTSHVYAHESFTGVEYDNMIMKDLREWTRSVKFGLSGNLLDDLKNTK